MENSSSHQPRRRINEMCARREAFRLAREADRQSAGSAVTAARALDQEQYRAALAATVTAAQV